jgi:hypothetical protein
MAFPLTREKCDRRTLADGEAAAERGVELGKSQSGALSLLESERHMTAIPFPVPANVRDFLQSFRPSSAQAAARFRFWHVERLLNQAADLLDRCLAEQAKYDALHAQGFASDFALRSEEEQLVIEELRVRNGVYDFSLLDARRKAQLADSVRSDHTEIGRLINMINHEQQVVNPHGPAPAKFRTIADLSQHEMEEKRLQLDQDLASLERDRVDGPTGSVALQKRLITEARARLDARRSASRNGEALDFHAQADRSLERITRDYSDATERLITASDGLLRIYGYPDPFPERLRTVVEGAPATIDDAVAWTREAIRWLAAFSQNDQSLTITVSLRGIIGEAGWTRVQTEGTTVPFRIARELFDGHRYVRLRGLAASLKLRSASLFPLRCVVTAPNTARFIMDEENGQAVVKPIDQSAMPACTLGRVSDFRVPVDAEICAAISLMNASPLGEDGDGGRWSIRVHRITDDTLDMLDDILLDVRVAGQPEGR